MTTATSVDRELDVGALELLAWVHGDHVIEPESVEVKDALRVFDLEETFTENGNVGHGGQDLENSASPPTEAVMA